MQMKRLMLHNGDRVVGQLSRSLYTKTGAGVVLARYFTACKADEHMPVLQHIASSKW